MMPDPTIKVRVCVCGDLIRPWAVLDGLYHCIRSQRRDIDVNTLEERVVPASALYEQSTDGHPIIVQVPLERWILPERTEP